jgi:hypothetical protein
VCIPPLRVPFNAPTPVFMLVLNVRVRRVLLSALAWAMPTALSTSWSGGAILPSLLHQDPRYFYQGTNKSCALHALSSPFICRGDNGPLQPNYSTIGGDLASAALANAYYPESNRGVRTVLGEFLYRHGPARARQRGTEIHPAQAHAQSQESKLKLRPIER